MKVHAALVVGLALTACHHDSKQNVLEHCASMLGGLQKGDNFERINHILSTCRVCDGASWAPLVADPTQRTTQSIDTVVKACGGACSGTARDNFVNAFDDAVTAHNPSHPWRTLAADCPETMGLLPSDQRFASAQWYVTHVIASKLHALPASATSGIVLDIPLPALARNGAGFELPEVPDANGIDNAAAIGQITITGNEQFAGALPFMHWNGLDIAVTPAGVDYPGDSVPPEQLGAKLEPISKTKEPIALIAPHALHAKRVLEVLRVAMPAIRGTGLVIQMGVTIHGANGWPGAPRLLTPTLSLEGDGTKIYIDENTTVDDLATKIAALAKTHVANVVLVSGL